MTDNIFTCDSKYGCEYKYECYRFMTTPLENQAIMDFSFGDINKDKNGKCKYFIKWEE